ncbi:MAG: NifB/NifX family molybdenum-iron cluster-binding protein [Bacillota bacterium]|uniref:NifB/NifX family molybdenum-iron cluster-binding protein n=1 Tax=Desulfurispora thermophila TaxID=265470 RepID=UPI00036C5CA5|nr:NifB/NifX family molybdenum-iron cluster-binding protein [Desulfurispora thermophila]
MKVAMPYENGQLNQHFGRSKEFAIIDVQDGNIADKKIVSAANMQHNHEGLAGLLAREKVDVVVLGGIGPMALQALKAQGLKTITGQQGDVEKLALACARGELVSQQVSCGHDHHHHHQHQHGGCGHTHGHGCGHHH